jgi:hypothetical protein
MFHLINATYSIEIKCTYMLSFELMLLLFSDKMIMYTGAKLA